MYVVRLYRLAHWFSRCRVPVLPALIKAFNRIFFGVVLPPSARLGRDVLLNY